MLSKLIETDSGAARLGEVALVSHSSPVSRENVIFYNGLLDENASCHLALGNAYPDCFSDPAVGNESAIHVDFMVGDEHLDIYGTCEDGSTVQLFRAGEFLL